METEAHVLRRRRSHMAEKVQGSPMEGLDTHAVRNVTMKALFHPGCHQPGLVALTTSENLIDAAVYAQLRLQGRAA